jgi:hypothetical protein
LDRAGGSRGYFEIRMTKFETNPSDQNAKGPNSDKLSDTRLHLLGKAVAGSLLSTMVLASLSLLLITGCATSKTKPATAAFERNFPANAFMTHRAIFTARGKQFALTGYLALSETGGKRLIISQALGQTMADLLVKPDGSVHVMQSSPMFKPEWVRRYVAADLECIFGGHRQKKCPVQMLDANHFLIKHFFYKLDLLIVETKAGQQPDRLFDPTQARNS